MAAADPFEQRMNRSGGAFGSLTGPDKRQGKSEFEYFRNSGHFSCSIWTAFFHFRNRSRSIRLAVTFLTPVTF
jgi:hypothetical protein